MVDFIQSIETMPQAIVAAALVLATAWVIHTIFRSAS